MLFTVSLQCCINTFPLENRSDREQPKGSSFNTRRVQRTVTLPTISSPCGTPAVHGRYRDTPQYTAVRLAISLSFVSFQLSIPLPLNPLVDLGEGQEGGHNSPLNASLSPSPKSLGQANSETTPRSATINQPHPLRSVCDRLTQQIRRGCGRFL